MTTLVVLLHGVGGHGAHMREVFAPLLPRGLALAAPDGPLALHPGRPQHAWFDITGISAQNRPGRVEAARTALDQALDRAEAEAGARRTVLLGFSQGSIMAIDALARGRVAEVVAFAGRWAFAGTPRPLPGARALLIGGRADRMMTPDDVTEAARHLRAAGVATELLIEPGIAHEIGPQGLAAALAFLQ